MKELEILAPAGGMPQLIAAVRSGADAVYVGLKKFSARASAANFTPEELKEAVEYCHAYGVKLHVTLNTIIYESEYSELFDQIEAICASGADAVIVQDLAVMKYVKRACPDIELHASTQMAIHNAEGAREAYRLGFSRVVLARELSLQEIRDIRKNTPPELELEAFVHGALCMSASGRCELSAMLGGRSGNRGRCAQPCRLDFSCGRMKSCLSLKDMSHIQMIRELSDAGVCSVKIEGRMKRPEYVASAVNACVEARDGKNADIGFLRDIFSRSGFTDGYLKARRDRNMFGVRTKEDVEASKDQFSRASELYRRERQRVTVSAILTVGKSKSSLLLSDGCFFAESSVEFEAGSDRAMEIGYVREHLSKLGGTPFVSGDIRLENPERLSLPPSVINSLRREAVGKLYELRAKSIKHGYSLIKADKYTKKAADHTEIYLKALCFDQISAIACKADKVILPIDEVIRREADIPDRSNLACEIPSLVYDFSLLDSKIDKLKEMGINRLLCDNIGSVAYAREKGFEVIGGFGLNIVNSDSLDEYRKMGVSAAVLSPEISQKDASNIGGEVRTGLFAYGYLPLMLFRSCPVRAAIGCDACAEKGEIVDRYGIKFRVLCHKRIYSELLNSVPHYLGDKRISTDFALLSFTTETRAECESVLDAFLSGEKIKKRTTGLYNP